MGYRSGGSISRVALHLRGSSSRGGKSGGPWNREAKIRGFEEPMGHKSGSSTSREEQFRGSRRHRLEVRWSRGHGSGGSRCRGSMGKGRGFKESTQSMGTVRSRGSRSGGGTGQGVRAADGGL